MQTENLSSGKTSLMEADPQAQMRTIVVWRHHQHGEPKRTKGKESNEVAVLVTPRGSRGQEVTCVHGRHREEKRARE